MLLKDKIVFIVGATGGIGQDVAKLFAKEGAFVYLGFSSQKEKAQELLTQIKDFGGRGEVIACDISSPKAISDGVSTILKSSDRIDGLINCSGVHVSGPLIGLRHEEIDQQILVNLTGAIYLTQAVITQMIKQRSGSIINLGSVSAHRMIKGHSVYSATKAGLEGFTKAIAAEVAKRSVRVNCVVPGPVMSAMLQKSISETGDDPTTRIPTGQLIRADEIAQTCAFLISDKAPSITGTIISVDGGYQLW